MNADIIALFAKHGPMTVTEAMAKGLGHICGACDNYNARHHLNRLLDTGELTRRTERRELHGGIGRYPRQSNVVVYKVKSR